MPLPTPNAGESRDDFVSRCMSAQGDEDKPQDQKLAICFSRWREVKKAEFDEQMKSDEAEVLAKFSGESNWSMPIVKVNEDNHFVLAPALIPDKVDRQGDVVSAEEIETAAHQFLSEVRKRDVDADLMHRIDMDDTQVALVESYISRVPVDFGKGNSIPEGTWMVGFEIRDSKLWSSIQKGELTGLSIFGSAEAEAA